MDRVNIIKLIKGVPKSPCESGCPTVKVKACENDMNRECMAFKEYTVKKSGKFNSDNIGRFKH